MTSTCLREQSDISKNSFEEVVFTPDVSYGHEGREISKSEHKAFSYYIMPYSRRYESPISIRERILKLKFDALTQAWLRDTQFLSSLTLITQHQAYLDIIAMGMDVVPFILKELIKQPGHWFFALEKITGENPIPAGHYGDMQAMSADWIRWGEKLGV